MQEALFYTREPDEKAGCLLCPHSCLIANGHAGICRVRKNVEGKLYSLVYGHLAAIHSDPIEKKPLYHFHPGSRIMSIGTSGCNLRCSFCQNYHLSQEKHFIAPETAGISPEELVAKAAGLPGNIGIAYTYNEPTVFYEFMADVSLLAGTKGLKNVVVSNGFINPAPLAKLLPLTDAFNIDLKAFDDDFYRKVTGGSLEPVLNTLKAIIMAGKHLEVTFLLIPGLNDSVSGFESMTSWIATELGEQVPLHISRYFPAWKQETPPTPLSLLEEFSAIARKKLSWVYPGNIAGSKASSTWCPSCGSLLIRREQYSTGIIGLSQDGKCNRCGYGVPIVLG
jgi:pyruvate formate lyase activating enzyme